MREKKYLSTEFEVHDYWARTHMLNMYVTKYEGSIYVELASVCLYFEEKLREELKNKWKDKSVIISFNDSIPVCFFAFDKFRNIIGLKDS